MRSCAYCIEALNSCINSENQAAESIKKHLSTSCLKVSSSSSSAIKELAESVKKMNKSPTIDLLVEEMNSALEELHNDLKSLSHLLNPSTTAENQISATGLVPFMEIIPVVTLASILIEISVRIEALVGSVEELVKESEMKDKIVAKEEKPEEP